MSVMFDWLLELIRDSPAAYPIESATVALDAFFPVVPGETAVIAAAVVAAGGGLSVVLVFLSAWLGAFVGDNISYALGAYVGRPVARRLFTGARSRRVLSWTHRQLEQRGALVIVGARFIPGGRTAVTVSCGLLDMPWRRFALADVVGTALWGGYATALGWFGGTAFRQSLWKPLAVSFAVAGIVALLGELVRRATETGADEEAAGRDVDEILGLDRER